MESCGRKQKGIAESRRSNGGNGRTEGMADGMVEWQTEMATYVLFRVHTDTDGDDTNDTLIFYSIDKPIGPTARKSVQGCLLYHL